MHERMDANHMMIRGFKNMKISVIDKTWTWKMSETSIWVSRYFWRPLNSGCACSCLEPYKARINIMVYDTLEIEAKKVDAPVASRTPLDPSASLSREYGRLKLMTWAGGKLLDVIMDICWMVGEESVARWSSIWHAEECQSLMLKQSTPVSGCYISWKRWS